MLRLRVASAAVLVPLLVLVLFLGRHAVAGAVALVVVLAAYEVSALLRAAGYENEPLLVAALGAGLVAEAWLLPGGVAGFTVAAAVVVGLASIAGLARSDPRGGSAAWLATAFGALYVGLASFLVRLIDAAPPLGTGAPLGAWLDAGQAWLLVTVLTVWAFDTAAYAVGRTWGRGRFMAHISPAKTWSGVAGGTVAAVAVAAATVWAVGQPALLGVPLGVVVAASGQVGDVAESMLKRAAGAKDSGTLIPGHGGILDRIDSFLFAAPAVYLFLVVLDILG